MNNTLDTTCEHSFNKIMKLAETEQTYEELLEMLSSDSIAKKQLAALKLNEIRTVEDAELLVSKLVNQNGKVREAVSFKINKLIKNEKYTKLFLNEKNYQIFLEAIIDINGNVCRQVVDFTNALKKHNTFSEYFAKKLMLSVNEIWHNIESLDLSSKQYVVSKPNFQLYWALEALYNFFEFTNEQDLKKILLNCGDFYDYTIREKVAKILSKYKTSDEDLITLRKKLENDENYFVKLAIKN